MFQEVLEQILQNTPGSVAVTLMGYDGIQVANQIGGSESVGSIDFESVAIELGSLAGQFKKQGAEIGVGQFREMIVEGDELTTVLRSVTQDYFLALSLHPSGNSGKGRYLLRTLGPKLIPDLT